MSDLFDFGPARMMFAVMGNPVSHSRSPQVHAMFAEQFGIDLEYRAIHVEVGGFEQAVSGFQASGGAGLNVTVPFKRNAWRLADDISVDAHLAKAVNTLVFGEQIYGDNTDGLGLIADIEINVGLSLEDLRILVIGAGGAAQGVLGSLLSKGPRSITVANRTKDRAKTLAKRFSSTGIVRGAGLDDVHGELFDAVINASSASLNEQLPAISPEIFAEAKLAYDMAYGTGPTVFQQWAKSNGVEVSADGLGMLVEQAAESFSVWHGCRPETAPVIDRLRRES